MEDRQHKTSSHPLWSSWKLNHKCLPFFLIFFLLFIIRNEIISVASSSPPSPLIEWTWDGGNDTLNALPNYTHKLGAFPGSRDTVVHFQVLRRHREGEREGGEDEQIPLLLECFGFGPDELGTFAWLSDCWSLERRKDIRKEREEEEEKEKENEEWWKWRWISGSPIANSSGNYSSSCSSSCASPGSRSGAILFPTNLPDVVGLFGGYGYASIPNQRGKLNDLWLFNTTSFTWFYLAGPIIVNATGNYTSPPSTSLPWPGSRVGASYWYSQDFPGQVYIFGGWGFASVPFHPGPLNDMWVLDLQVTCASSSCLEADITWEWVGGPDIVHVPGNTSLPPGRYGTANWLDPTTGDCYLFGGYGADGDLGDFWVWRNPFNGSESLPVNSWKNITSENLPGARYSGITWNWPGSSHVLVLFGGSAFNDFWAFDTQLGVWFFLGGSPSQNNSFGNYGTLHEFNPNNWPGGRYGSAIWFNPDDTSLTLFGGFGYPAANLTNTEGKEGEKETIRMMIMRENEGEVEGENPFTSDLNDIWTLRMLPWTYS